MIAAFYWKTVYPQAHNELVQQTIGYGMLGLGGAVLWTPDATQEVNQSRMGEEGREGGKGRKGVQLKVGN